MNSKEQILEMVKEGTLSVEEGLKLLSAMETKQPVSEVRPSVSNARRMIKILINSKDGDDVKVNIPLALVKVGLDIGSKMNVNGKQLDLQGVDLDSIMQMIDEGASGELVNVQSADGETVRIFVD